MENMFEITVVDEVIASTLGKDFKEFCESIDQLETLVNPEMYLEAVEDATPNLRRTFKGVHKNTMDTTRDIYHAYGNVVDGNAKLIKSTWDLVMRSIQLITRIIGFILGKISAIPKGILKAAETIANIPETVLNKIKGNIQLYITADDLENLYNQTLIHRIDTFISTANSLSQGELWGTFLSRQAKVVGGKVYASQNDIKACKQLEKIYEHIKYLEFTPTNIEMKDIKARNMYFGNSKSVKFTDLKGVKFQGTYYEALIKLTKDIESRREDLKKVHEALGQKYNQTQLNQTFGKLSRGDQYRITDTIRMMSKVVSIVGNITKYIMIDMQTITKSTDKMLKKNSSGK